MRARHSCAPAQARVSRTEKAGGARARRYAFCEDGFSLIEALVALLVLAIGAAGLIRAAEAHVDSIRGLEQRAAAQWVAENRLAELRLGGAAAAGAPASVQMMGRAWQVAVTMRANPDADLRDVEVSVRPADGAGPAVTLHGFIDAGTTTS